MAMRYQIFSGSLEQYQTSMQYQHSAGTLTRSDERALAIPRSAMKIIRMRWFWKEANKLGLAEDPSAARTHRWTEKNWTTWAVNCI